MTLFSVRFSVARWSIWTDAEWYDHPGGAQPAAGDLGRQIGAGIRRRLGLFGRAIAEVMAHAKGDCDAPSLILASRNGDTQRTLKMLEQIARQEGPSPTDFSMSVHNAPLGISAIQWSIRTPHTAIAAGTDTFIAGLTEAATQLHARPQQPVLLVYTDMPLPEVYADHDPPAPCSCAFGMLLTGPEEHGDTLEMKPLNPIEQASVWPAYQALALADWLNTTEKSLELTGQHGGWQLRRS